MYMWKQQGIDSGEFSRSLMRYAKQAIKDGEADPVKGASPLPDQSFWGNHYCTTATSVLWREQTSCAMMPLDLKSGVSKYPPWQACWQPVHCSTVRMWGVLSAILLSCDMAFCHLLNVPVWLQCCGVRRMAMRGMI